MTISERVASNARMLCKYKGKNIGDMEAAAGISTGLLSRCKGRAKLPVDVCYALAEYLGVTVDQLISNELIRNARITELKAELARLMGEAFEEEFYND